MFTIYSVRDVRNGDLLTHSPCHIIHEVDNFYDAPSPLSLSVHKLCSVYAGNDMPKIIQMRNIRTAWLPLAGFLFVYYWLFIHTKNRHNHLGIRSISEFDSNSEKSHFHVFTNDKLGSSLATTVNERHRKVAQANSWNESANVISERRNPILGLVEQRAYSFEKSDRHEYRSIHNPQNMCRDWKGNKIPVYVLFLVVTAPDNTWQREIVRSTYGDSRMWPKISHGAFKRVFLIGATEHPQLQLEIDSEFERYGDILQEDFADSYLNLTLKTVMGLKWASHHCRHATYVMKIDDDTMIVQERFMTVIRGAPNASWTAGQAMYDAPVLRDPISKYYVSEEFYQSATYPPYLNGPAYLLSSDLVEAVYEMALTTPLFPWEDVFVGICLQRLRIEIEETTRFLKITSPAMTMSRKMRRRLNMFVAITGLGPEHMELVWEVGKLQSLSTRK